jgi:hypothetical protein
VDTLDLVRQNLLSPIVLGFVLGALATAVKSDLRIPEPLYAGLSLYLLLAIGLKGGAALAQTPIQQVALPALGTLILGAGTTFTAYGLLRLGKFDIPNAAGIAAHYGSVSAVTFMAAQTFVEVAQKPSPEFMPALVALLEVPALVIGLLLARRTQSQAPFSKDALRDVLTGRSILLLVGGIVVGWAAGPAGLAPIKPVFVDAFPGLLVIFMVEMGMVAARRMQDVKRVGPILVSFALIVPVLHGALGAWLGTLVGLGVGGATVMGAMAASASYIAAPAAVRIGIPEANPSFSLTAALGITFPFNLAVGLPLYFEIARRLSGVG